ncbi:hypothetical protein AMAG_04741 [Allomyces macrogynus ATCC 38327]|uniref:Uncharacterized protein n=1 Tax=Allomyces macrogynus (strain ATCC 38327) TaxID=578462 RepID=A0A0L0S5W9_ALLM3|nr:hypothetical protein AMAG_04741 [Allomyces macrogynus ATCC 38327]|eukprot:KNE57897.1 hypothetical protein AMAG_04741 [Allomyces macrogynus ATCC 38327]
MTALFNNRLEPSFQRTIAKCEPLGADAQKWADRIAAALKHPRGGPAGFSATCGPTRSCLTMPMHPRASRSWTGNARGLGTRTKTTQYLANLVAMRAGARQTPDIFDAGAVDAMIDLPVAAAKPLDETYDHAAMALRYVGYLTWFPHFGVKDAARGIAEAAQELDAIFGKGK